MSLIDGDKAECIDLAPARPPQPGITSDEARAAAQACAPSPLFRAALASRGIHDVSLVMIDAESMGGFEPAEYRDRRVTWGSVWHRTHRGRQRLRPARAGRRPDHRHDDHGGPRGRGPRDRPAVGRRRATRRRRWSGRPPGLRAARHRAAATARASPSTGRRSTGRAGRSSSASPTARAWCSTTSTFAGRPVLRRAACNEMYVPYLDTNPTQYRKNFFDWGEYGARPADQLAGAGLRLPRRDPLLRRGRARRRRRAADRSATPSACTRRTHGIALEAQRRAPRHQPRCAAPGGWSSPASSRWRTTTTASTGRSTRTDRSSSRSSSPASSRRLGHRRGRRGRRTAGWSRRACQAPNHQHYFAHPAGHGRRRAAQPPRRGARRAGARSGPQPVRQRGARPCVTADPQRDRRGAQLDAARSVHWRVESADRRNRSGEPTAYRLMIDGTAAAARCGRTACAPAAPRSSSARCGPPRTTSDEQFVAASTPTRPNRAPTACRSGSGEDRSLLDTELVLWATVSSHHFPRPEDWPVMPVASTGLRLEPDGFFDRNPALDLPRPIQGGATACH